MDKSNITTKAKKTLTIEDSGKAGKPNRVRNQEPYAESSSGVSVRIPVLCHLSALEYWRMADIAPTDHSFPTRAKALLSIPPTSAQEEYDIFQSFERPLHVLVDEERKRREIRLIKTHTCCGSFPKGSILENINGLLVSSPEFCFVQSAESLPLMALIQLGFEMCGTYRQKKSGSVYHCDPLTSVAHLAKYISKLKRVRGMKKAARAIRFVVDNSASPMETNLTMLLCLPCSLGGYGLPKPKLNYRVDITNMVHGRSAKSFYVCDLLWRDAHFCFEYDSILFHAEEACITNDSIKRSDLTALGITVISVRRKQVMCETEMEKLAFLCAKHVGKRIRLDASQFRKKQSELRKILSMDIVNRY